MNISLDCPSRKESSVHCLFEIRIEQFLYNEITFTQAIAPSCSWNLTDMTPSSFSFEKWKNRITVKVFENYIINCDNANSPEPGTFFSHVIFQINQQFGLILPETLNILFNFIQLTSNSLMVNIFLKITTCVNFFLLFSGTSFSSQSNFFDNFCMFDFSFVGSVFGFGISFSLKTACERIHKFEMKMKEYSKLKWNEEV